VKVLHLTDDMEMLGGVQRYLGHLRAILPEHGVECEVWAARPGLARGAASRWYSRRYRSSLRKLIRRSEPDLVHAHNLWMRLSPAPLDAAVEAKIPVVMTVHDYALVCPRKWMITAQDRPCEIGYGPHCAVSACRGSREGRFWMGYNALRWLKTGLHRRLLVDRVAGFVSPSRHLARWLERSLGVGRVVHIPNFALMAGDGSFQPVTNPRRLAYAGRLSPEKGVDLLLESFPRVVEVHPDARLTIAGDGPLRRDLERRAGALGIAGVVDFVGRLGGVELERFFVNAGLVVLPTMWMENCPVSVLEAFAHGRAVVATEIGGVPELVVDGRTGVVFDRGDSRQLSHRLVDLLSAPERISDMGKAAHESWSQDFTPQRHAERLRRLYRTTLDAGV
jgi:glycosyltransferase involved in cell wall biosynthesis